MDPKTVRYAAALSSAVLVKGVLLYGAYLLGDKIDQRFGTKPFGLFILLVMAAAVGLWWILRVAEREKPR